MFPLMSQSPAPHHIPHSPLSVPTTCPQSRSTSYTSSPPQPQPQDPQHPAACLCHTSPNLHIPAQAPTFMLTKACRSPRGSARSSWTKVGLAACTAKCRTVLLLLISCGEGNGRGQDSPHTQASTHGTQKPWETLFLFCKHPYVHYTGARTMHSTRIPDLRGRHSDHAAVVKTLPANAEDTRDMVSIPGLGRSPGGGNGNPL